ncbi:hypothetical protein AN958_04073 [Leucoagaricus sp. SymC.cos]|nr:hypothetical protein AN958_04073 [Leucoagaricus sp. SymC.cos]
MTVCDSHRLESVLEELTLCEEIQNSIENIKILVTHVTVELMDVLSRFPSMKEIFLESQDSMIPIREPPAHSAHELLPDSPVSVLYSLLGSHKFPLSLEHLSFTTHLKNSSSLDSKTQCVDAARFTECLGGVNPRLKTIDVSYGTYWTGVVDVNWRRRTSMIRFQHDSSESSSEANLAETAIHPSEISLPSRLPFSSSTTDSSLSSLASESSEAAVEKFFALPSRPKPTVSTIHLRLGDMTFSEQRHAAVLPGRFSLPQQAKVDTPRLGWIAGGVSRVWQLVGTVSRLIGEGVGISRG